MKFTLGELLSVRENLTKLTQIKDIPAITGYRIATVVRKLSDHIMSADNARSTLIRKFAGDPDKDNKVTVLPENMMKFMTELNELLTEEVDVEIKEVKLPEDIKLPDATTLVGLDRFITV
jgi:hypothetical protein